MFTQEQLKNLHQLNTELEHKRKLLDKKLSELPPYPHNGDIFMFDNPDSIGLQWVVLYSYENKLFLTVPADTNPIVGSTDIAISKSGLCGAITLRCSQYAWIDKADFDLNLRVGILENWHLQRATNKINQIFENNIQSKSWQKETDVNPEYDKWITQVNYGRKTLKQIAQLNDFKVIESNEEDVLMLCVSLALFDSELQLEVFWEDGTAQLVGEKFKFLALNDYIFEFIEEDEEWLCELSPEMVSKIAKVLKLAQPYQEWETSIANRQSLQNKVKIGQIKKTIIYLNAQQRQIIDYLSKAAEKASISLIEVLEELLNPLETNAVRGNNPNNKTNLNLLNPLVSKIEQLDEQWCLSLVWLTKPEITPIVELEINGKPKIDAHWENDYSSLQISGFKGIDIDEVGIFWDDKSGKLLLLLK